MNALDDLPLDRTSFSWREIQGQDVWTPFTPAFTSLTVVGATTYTGRFRIVGKQCFFQVTLLAATSIASTAGTTYMTLPITPKGIAGTGTMTDVTTAVAVGTCHVDVTNGRLYLTEIVIRLGAGIGISDPPAAKINLRHL